jgi:ribonuclease P protein component
MLRYTFNKAERLSSRSLIQEIYTSKGIAKNSQYPLLFVYKRRPVPGDFPAQVLVSVPKKAFRKSHERQRIKRLIREAWRLHKQMLYAWLDAEDQQMALALVYIAREELSFKEIEHAIIQGIRKIIQQN